MPSIRWPIHWPGVLGLPKLNMGNGSIYHKRRCGALYPFSSTWCYLFDRALLTDAHAYMRAYSKLIGRQIISMKMLSRRLEFVDSSYAIF